MALGVGAGYARNELSLAGERAQIAAEGLIQVFRKGDEVLTIRIRACVKRMQELHGRNIVNIYLQFEHDNQPFPVHPDR